MPLKTPIKILISVDFDAVSGWLGTGSSPENNMADYSTGVFAARVGVPRLLKLFDRLHIANNVTWFLPGHSIESFPDQTAAIVSSGAEIGLHGYCHENSNQLTELQERDVIEKCISLVKGLTGRTPKGFRAPLYSLRGNTIKILEQNGIVYDSSLSGHDSELYFLPEGGGMPIQRPRFEPHVKAEDWMHPLPKDVFTNGLIEIPCGWYTEDMTPLQFWPHNSNSQGYVDTRLVEQMWKDRFEFIHMEASEKQGNQQTVFPLIMHPDTAGMAHVLPMIERFLKWLLEKKDDVEFVQYGVAAAEWKSTYAD
ncbi:polysaccharide deacetylase [Microthyrium microscopicum]|uniref:Polysaccharide deacetylase n=1 Tax=Microthyrium microscopicum TaxID=703497 RepID=A0A6A6UNE1_9PEZI|nr:polysaccharide deacetylase [Microthyrium microscopicum]